MTDKTPGAKLRERIEAEISKLPNNRSADRQKIYDKFRTIIAGNPKFAHLSDALEDTIRQVEQLEFIHAPQSSPEANAAASDRSKPKSLTRLALGIAALVIVAGAGWLFMSGSESNSEFDDGIAGYSTGPEAGKEIAANDARYMPKRDGQDFVLELTGYSPVFITESIQIDPAKTYKISTKIRTLKDDPKQLGAKMHVGVATFDADGKLQTSPPGAHRYAAMLNKVLKSSDGWVEAEGLITGEGNENHKQFRPGTRFVKPVALINYGNPDAVSQISYLRFEEVKN